MKNFQTVSEQDQVEEIYQDVLNALSDVDENDDVALLERCEQIIDDIHTGRF